MRKFAVFAIAAATIAASITSGQWLETTIQLIDSTGGVSGPRRLTYNSVNNSLYVIGAGGACVQAIDGTTNQKTARIPVGSVVWALCYNPENNKV